LSKLPRSQGKISLHKVLQAKPEVPLKNGSINTPEAHEGYTGLTARIVTSPATRNGVDRRDEKVYNGV